MATKNSKISKKTSFISKVKAKVIDKASDVLSMPARMRANRIIRESGEDAKAIKAYRAIRGKPIEPFDESNPDFRTRANAIQAEFRTEQRSKKPIY